MLFKQVKSCFHTKKQKVIIYFKMFLITFEILFVVNLVNFRILSYF